MKDDEIRENWIEWMTGYFGKEWSLLKFRPKSMEYSHSQGYKYKCKEVSELKECNKILAEVNLNNAGKIAELENKLGIVKKLLVSIKWGKSKDVEIKKSVIKALQSIGENDEL